MGAKGKLSTAVRCCLAAAALLLFACSSPKDHSTSESDTLQVLSAEGARLPALPRGWPEHLHLGMATPPGGALAMKATAPFQFRYQYLAGGANTGEGWRTWNPRGQFVTDYIKESVTERLTPVFTYYMIYQSLPGSKHPEAQGVRENLQSVPTMTAYYQDLRAFFEQAATSSASVILHVEPDLWAHMQRDASNGPADKVSVRVGSTGVRELANLPDNASGFAQAIIRLRDTLAPNVLLAFHASSWATGDDIHYARASNHKVAEIATTTARFYKSLGADFDLVFTEFTDRDAGFKEAIYKDGGASWWRPEDFKRHLEFIRVFVQQAQKRVVLWQIPYGNTKMQALNNTWNHFQDNRVEWLLEDSRSHLAEYAQAGVVALLFGRGADGATCACDDAKDGVTNPQPINGNKLPSVSADDDGGFFRQQAGKYYGDGALALP
jgi:hypothetical protein